MSNSRFQIALIIILIILLIFSVIRENNVVNSIPEDENRVIVFSQPACKSCKKEKDYINDILKEKYPQITVKYYDVTKSKNMKLLRTYFERYGLSEKQLVTPVTFVGDNYMIGYKNDETSGKQLEAMIKGEIRPPKTEFPPKYIDTWFGRVNLVEKSLPVLAITLGLADGFNPCAMWVLVYMISLIAGLKDKRKIWLIVGTFVLASAILYYLFMTALLNVFLYVGYLRILRLIIGYFAIYVGVMNIKTFISERGQVSCKVQSPENRQHTMEKVKKLVESKISFFTVLGIIALAFAVNSIEFICSAALPAIFTGVLAQAQLSLLEYYLYILLYVFFFMLNELIIFGSAAFAAGYYVSDRLIAPIKLISGLVILGLGVVMVFSPEVLG